MNTKFSALKTRSKELNQKMADIRWCLSTMQGVITAVCLKHPPSSMGRDISKFLDTLCTSGCDHHNYWVEAGFSGKGKPFIRILSPTVGIKDPDGQWTPEEIDLVHAKLDVVIDACEDFCREAGREPAFQKMMADLS